MEEDAGFAVVGALVPKRVLQGGLVPRGRARELVRPHGDCDGAVEVDGVVAEHDVRPPLAWREPFDYQVDYQVNGGRFDVVLFAARTMHPMGRTCGKPHRNQENCPHPIAA